MSDSFSKLKETFKHLNLSENEAKVYFYLLNHGTSTIADVAKSTGLARSSCYDTLDRLIREGFVTKTYEGREEFMAENPSLILSRLENLHKTTSSIVSAFSEELPHLLAISQVNSFKPKIKYLQGEAALTNLLATMLKEAEGKVLLNMCLGYSDTEAGLDKDPPYLLDFLEKAKSVKFREKIIMEDMKSAREYISKYKSEGEEVLLIRPVQNSSSVHIDKFIWDDKVAIFNFQQDYAVLIEDNFIANNERVSFELLWERLKSN